MPRVCARRHTHAHTHTQVLLSHGGCAGTSTRGGGGGLSRASARPAGHPHFFSLLAQWPGGLHFSYYAQQRKAWFSGVGLGEGGPPDWRAGWMSWFQVALLESQGHLCHIFRTGWGMSFPDARPQMGHFCGRGRFCLYGSPLCSSLSPPTPPPYHHHHHHCLPSSGFPAHSAKRLSCNPGVLVMEPRDGFALPPPSPGEEWEGWDDSTYRHPLSLLFLCTGHNYVNE